MIETPKEKIIREAAEQLCNEVLHARRYDPNGTTDDAMQPFFEQVIKEVVDKTCLLALADQEVKTATLRDNAERALHALKMLDLKPMNCLAYIRGLEEALNNSNNSKRENE